VRVGTEPDCLDIHIVHAGDPAGAATDLVVRISVSIEMKGFAAHVVEGVGRREWDAFLAALADIHRRSSGAARLQSLGPEIDLVFTAGGRDGDVVVAGSLVQPQDEGLRLAFTGFAIGSHQLEELLDELKLETFD
jgi:hypothetical protein